MANKKNPRQGTEPSRDRNRDRMNPPSGEDMGGPTGERGTERNLGNEAERNRGREGSRRVQKDIHDSSRLPD